jgi:hypothetical protein
VKTSPEIWLQKNWLLHDDNTTSHNAFFTWEFFYQTQHDFHPYPPYLPDLAPSVLLIEDKIENPPF